MENNKEIGRVHVAVRCRPLISNEICKEEDSCIGCNEVASEVLIGTDRRFTFDTVFGTSTKQEELYTKTISKYLEDCFNGFNTTVFAYGQTNSGKTHTIGTNHNQDTDSKLEGIIPRVVSSFFNRIHDESIECVLKVSFVEIYNEKIRDLLCISTPSKSLNVREAPNGQTLLEGAKEIKVNNSNDVFECLEAGCSARSTGATLMNQESSRSHAIFTLHLTQQSEDEHGPIVISSKFRMVDLAGSERVKRTGAVGQRFKESVKINQGLLSLGKVISALGDPAKRINGRLPHVPYRESKLTRLLKDSIGGNSRTLMIACITPAVSSFEETLSTLKFANNAKNIQNKPVKNIGEDTKEQEMKNKIDELEQELLEYKQQGRSDWATAALDEDAEKNVRLAEQLCAVEGKYRKLLGASRKCMELLQTAVSNDTDAISLKTKISEACKGFSVVQELKRSSMASANATSSSIRSDVTIPAQSPQTIPDMKHALAETEKELADTQAELKLVLKRDQEIFNANSTEIHNLHKQISKLKTDLLSSRRNNNKPPKVRRLSSASSVPPKVPITVAIGPNDSIISQHQDLLEADKETASVGSVATVIASPFKEESVIVNPNNTSAFGDLEIEEELQHCEEDKDILRKTQRKLQHQLQTENMNYSSAKAAIGREMSDLNIKIRLKEQFIRDLVKNENSTKEKLVNSERHVEELEGQIEVYRAAVEKAALDLEKTVEGQSSIHEEKENLETELHKMITDRELLRRRLEVEEKAQKQRGDELEESLAKAQRQMELTEEKSHSLETRLIEAERQLQMTARGNEDKPEEDDFSETEFEDHRSDIQTRMRNCAQQQHMMAKLERLTKHRKQLRKAKEQAQHKVDMVKARQQRSNDVLFNTSIELGETLGQLAARLEGEIGGPNESIIRSQMKNVATKQKILDSQNSAPLTQQEEMDFNESMDHLEALNEKMKFLEGAINKIESQMDDPNSCVARDVLKDIEELKPSVARKLLCCWCEDIIGFLEERHQREHQMAKMQLKTKEQDEREQDLKSNIREMRKAFKELSIKSSTPTQQQSSSNTQERLIAKETAKMLQYKRLASQYKKELKDLKEQFHEHSLLNNNINNNNGNNIKMNNNNNNNDIIDNISIIPNKNIGLQKTQRKKIEEKRVHPSMAVTVPRNRMNNINSHEQVSKEGKNFGGQNHNHGSGDVSIGRNNNGSSNNSNSTNNKATIARVQNHEQIPKRVNSGGHNHSQLSIGRTTSSARVRNHNQHNQQEHLPPKPSTALPEGKRDDLSINGEQITPIKPNSHKRRRSLGGSSRAMLTTPVTEVVEVDGNGSNPIANESILRTPSAPSRSTALVQPPPPTSVHHLHRPPVLPPQPQLDHGSSAVPIGLPDPIPSSSRRQHSASAFGISASSSSNVLQGLETPQFGRSLLQSTDSISAPSPFSPNAIHPPSTASSSNYYPPPQSVKSQANIPNLNSSVSSSTNDWARLAREDRILNQQRSPFDY